MTFLISAVMKKLQTAKSLNFDLKFEDTILLEFEDLTSLIDMQVSATSDGSIFNR